MTNSSPSCEEAEVAGAQERPVARRASRAPKVARRLLGPVPVAVRRRSARRPRSRRPGPAGSAAPVSGSTIATSLVRARRAPQPTSRRLRRSPSPARSAASRAPARRRRSGRTAGSAGGAAGDDQRRLGQAVAGVERLAAEAAGGEGLGEAVERLGADRLGAVEGHPPAARGRARSLLGA